MIRVAIVEDESAYIEQIKEHLKCFRAQSGEKMEISVFSDGEEIVTGYCAGYDIIFLDIQMKFMDGMTAAERIRGLDSEVIIIFITNMAQYAIQGYRVDALDFVLKPINYIAFSQTLRRAMERLRRREKKYLTIPANGGFMRLELNGIKYIEIIKHNVVVHAENADYTFTSSLKEVEEKLSGEHFFRCNYCYLVNLAQVESVRESTAIVGGVSLQISRPRRKAFLTALTDYLGEGGR